jgi:hypothetical protein
MQLFNLNPMIMFSWERDKNWRSYSNITPHSSKFSHIESHATRAAGTGLWRPWRVQIYQPVPVPASNPHANPCGFENPCRSLCTTMVHYHKCSITWRSLIHSSSSHKVLSCLLFANTEVNCFVPLPFSALKSGPVRFFRVFWQNRDRTGPRSFQNPKKPDRNR